MERPPDPILEDLVVPGLRLVFCGTAAGTRSAAERAYYAHPGNKFWRTLHAVGLTGDLLAPRDWRRVSEYGIGLTDLVKHSSGPDSVLPRDGFDAERVRRLIADTQPTVLAFTSKTAGQSFLGRSVPAYGEQPERVGATRVWVLPSPSGRAAGYWSLSWWGALAAALGRGAASGPAPP